MALSAIYITGLVAFIGAVATMAMSLFHWFGVMLDLWRPNAPLWVWIAGPLNFILPGALSVNGRAHRNKALLWLLATGFLLATAFILKRWSQS